MDKFLLFVADRLRDEKAELVELERTLLDKSLPGIHEKPTSFLIVR